MSEPLTPVAGGLASGVASVVASVEAGPADEERQLNRFAEYLWVRAHTHLPPHRVILCSAAANHERKQVVGGTTAAGQTATCWAWDGEVQFRTVKGKTTREARFVRQPSIANHLGQERARTGAGACVMKDRLYCLGGFSDEYGALQSVISFNKHSRPKDRQWHKEGSMIARRDGVAAAAYEDSQGFGVLIAIGGTNGSGILNSCEQAM